MAQLDKLRRVLQNRYTPFFLPVIASLAYIGFVIAVIPENLGQSSSSSEENVESETSTAEPANSGATAQDAALRAAKRRARLANRAIKQTVTPSGAFGNSHGAAAPAVVPPPPVPMPAPLPASPDGAD